MRGIFPMWMKKGKRPDKPAFYTYIVKREPEEWIRVELGLSKSVHTDL